jgi:hypothetical protein
MNVTTHEVEAPGLCPSFIRPYLKAIENIGTIAENITATGVVVSQAALAAAELSKAMIELRLAEVTGQLTPRASLT